MLLLTSLFSLAATSNSQVLSKTFNLRANSTKLLYITNNNIDLDIEVKSEGKVVSKQNGPETIMASEFVLLHTGATTQSFTIKATPTHKAGFSPSWRIEDKSSSNIALYRNLYLASMKWALGDKESQIQATELTKQTLQQASQDSDLYLQAVVLYAAMLAKHDLFEKVYLIVEKARSARAEIPWLYDYKLTWLQADARLMVDNRAEGVALYARLVDMKQQHPSNQAVLLRQTQVLGDYGLAQLLRGWQNGNTQFFEAGRKNIEKAVSIAEQAGDFLMLSNFHNHMWTYWAINRDLNKGEASLQLALSYAKRSELNTATLEIYTHLAKKHLMSRQLALALQTYRQALVLVKQTSRVQTQSTIYEGLANTYQQLGDLETAKRYYQSALTSHKVLGAQYGQADIQRALGNIVRTQGKLDEAVDYHKSAWQIFDLISPEDSIKAAVDLARDYYLMGEVSRAQNYVKLALEQLDLLRLGSDKVEVLLISAKIAQALNNESTFIRGLKLIETEYAQELLPLQQLDLTRLWIEHYIKTHDVANLKLLLASSNSQIEAIRKRLNTDWLGPVWSSHADAVHSQFVSVIMSLAKQLDDQSLYQQVFMMLEQSQSVNLRKRRQLIKATEQTSERESRLTSALWNDWLAAQRLLIDAQDKQQRDIARVNLDSKREAYLAKVMAHSTQTDDELEVLTIAQVQNRLQADQMFVRYYLRDHIGFAFVVTKNRWQVIDLPSKAKLTEDIQQLLGQYQQQSIASSTPLKSIQQILPLKQINSDNIKELIVVPDDVLNVLPIEALNISPINKRYQPLVEKVDIVRTFSGSEYFSNINKAVEDDTFDIAIFADPVFTETQPTTLLAANTNEDNLYRNWRGGLSRLKWTAVEAQAIKSLFSKSQVKVITEKAATNEALMSKSVRSADILHIASHGYFNDEVPEVVGIATSVIDENNQKAPGFLSLTELLSKPFSSALVVISGCETVLGQQLNGEGLNSLTRGVLAQGAGSVISTIWSIPDKPTAEFMKAFYQNLKRLDGDSAAALNLTKRNFARRGRYRLPLYWAGFVFTSSNAAFESLAITKVGKTP